MSNQFKIFLLVVLSVFSTLNLSANDTFFSTEKSSNSVEELANTVGKSKIITKLDALGDLSFAKNFVNSLDDVADASFLAKLDNLTDVKLQQLDNHYKTLKHPQGYGGQMDYTVTKVIDGQSVSVTYKKGMPDLRSNSPILNFTDGTTASKFKFESPNLTGAGTDFTQANTALAKKFGIEKSGGNWPWNNGYMTNGNFRIAQTNSGGMSKQFQLFENGNWETYTWHHFEDGRTLFPVKTSIHSVPKGFNHSGGKSIISKGLQDLFEFMGF